MDLEGLTIEPKITFADGSAVNIAYDDANDTFEVISGTDVTGQKIPLAGNPSGLGGSHRIISAHQWAQFQDHAQYYWLAQFVGGYQAGQSCSTKCKLVGSGKYECTIQCD